MQKGMTATCGWAWVHPSTAWFLLLLALAVPYKYVFQLVQMKEKCVAVCKVLEWLILADSRDSVIKTFVYLYDGRNTSSCSS